MKKYHPNIANKGQKKVDFCELYQLMGI